MYKKHYRRSGFSLVEILVTTAILGGLSLAFISFIGNAVKAQKNVQNAVDFDILKTSINLVLNTRACDGSFQTASGNPIVITYPTAVTPGTNVITTPLAISKIVQGSSAIVDMTAPNLGAGMTLTSIQFTDAVYDGIQTIPPTTYFAFAAVLKVEAQKAAGSYGAQSYSKTFGVRILVNPTSSTTGNVEKCGATSFDAPKVFGANGVSTPPDAAHCPAVWNAAGFCTSYYQLAVAFPMAFTAIPKVIVSIESATSSSFPCPAATTDHIAAFATNITTTGFTLNTGTSPGSGHCGADHDKVLPADASWLAIGI